MIIFFSSGIKSAGKCIGCKSTNRKTKSRPKRNCLRNSRLHVADQGKPNAIKISLATCSLQTFQSVQEE